jgi:hypothetical protein
MFQNNTSKMARTHSSAKIRINNKLNRPSKKRELPKKSNPNSFFDSFWESKQQNKMDLKNEISTITINEKSFLAEFNGENHIQKQLFWMRKETGKLNEEEKNNNSYVEIRKRQHLSKPLNRTNKKKSEFRTNRKIGIYEREITFSETNKKLKKKSLVSKREMNQKKISQNTNKKYFSKNGEENQNRVESDLFSTNKKNYTSPPGKDVVCLSINQPNEKLFEFKQKPKILFNMNNNEMINKKEIHGSIVSIHNSGIMSNSNLNSKKIFDNLTIATKNTFSEIVPGSKIEEEPPNRKTRKVRLNKISKSFINFESILYI